MTTTATSITPATAPATAMTAAAAPARPRLTAAEYATLPETLLPTELIDGEIVEMPAPTLHHQRLAARIFKVIDQLKPDGEVYFAPADVHLDDRLVVQPDVLWVAADNTRCVNVEDKYFRGAPDLVVEILSPGTAFHDRVTKFALYEQHGTRELWLIDAAEGLIEVWSREEAAFRRVGLYGRQQTFTSPLFNQPVAGPALFGEATA
ncbi:MAG: Uma2 family endonuclease [Anaerolineae bacterium]|jgi:Uma2 family endonuclease|nr:Uma2 family endonuclease [Anaerolineae bacterium]